jgi:SfnB family sulfur acquisition oxidoreductase
MTVVEARAAHVITSCAEAVAAAAELAPRIRAGAADRDRLRVLPHAELAWLSASGLLGIFVPAEYGGADADVATVTEVVRILAAADPNVAQIPHSHFVYVNMLRHQGSAAQRAFFFAEVLAGKRLANAQSETGTKHVQDIRTTLVACGTDEFLLTGVKGYCTGTLYADWIPVLAHLGPDGPLHVAYVEATAPGVTIVDDWDGLGQRTTASGTVRLEGVVVPADRIVPYHLTFTGPQLYGAFAQILHAAIDTGIAAAALEDAVEFVRTKSRPYPDAHVERPTEDPLVVQRVGELAIEVRSAEAVLVAAAREVDTARRRLTAESAARASVAVATARAVSTRASVDVSSALFEVSGTRSALAALGLDRHWRNARTHTLHDPLAWKVQHIGRYTLNGTPPPRHGQL